MTSATSDVRANERRDSGFTLVELLIAVMIIMALASILLLTIGHVHRKSTQTAMAADLAAISAGLQAYKSEFGYYPPIPRDSSGQPTITTGAHVLCQAIIAPAPADSTIPGADGWNGPGFKIRVSDTQVHGPYVQTDRFRCSVNAGATDWRGVTILDRWGNPILYFLAARQRPDVTGANGYIGTGNQQCLYNADENLPLMSVNRPDALEAFAVFLGDFNHNGTIDGSETPATTADFILWSAGEDGLYGPARPGNPLDPNAPPTPQQWQDAARKCDDSTTFYGQ